MRDLNSQLLPLGSNIFFYLHSKAKLCWLITQREYIKMLKSNMTILFQGDSITDCGRRDSFLNPMGFGYAYFVASWLSALYPELNLNFVNKGVSGDCTDDLLQRWDKDTIKLKPDLLSILIGVNNTWKYGGYNDFALRDNFLEDYYQILKRTQDKCDTKIILCEPFLLPVSSEMKLLNSDIIKKIEQIKKLSIEFDALVVPFSIMFEKATKKANSSYWAPDGVHPTAAGHTLMAQEWMKCVCKIETSGVIV